MAVHLGGALKWFTIIALATWAGIWWQTDLTRWQAGTLPAANGQAGAFLRPLCTVRADHASEIALDASANHIGIIGPAGQIRILDATGHPLTDVSVPGADAFAFTPEGQRVVAYARANASHTEVVFMRLDGSVLWRHDPGTAILDVAVAQSGQRAACVTADGYVYSYQLDEAPSFRRWRSVGNPTGTYVTPDGALVLVATADPPSVWAYTPAGVFLWKAPNSDPKGDAQIFASPDGQFLACATMPKDARSGSYTSRFVVLSRSGRQQWGAKLRASHPRVALSTDGKWAAVTYTKSVSTSPEPTYERKVVLFRTSSAGSSVPDQLWQHGGPLYDPRLVCIAGDGSFVATHDGKRSIFFFGPTGQLLWRHKMAHPIVRTCASADGLSILVHCADGSLSLLRVADGR